jgi:hypothetical protein
MHKQHLPLALATATAAALAHGAVEKYDALGADVKPDDVNGDGRADLLAGSYENS